MGLHAVGTWAPEAASVEPLARTRGATRLGPAKGPRTETRQKKHWGRMVTYMSKQTNRLLEELCSLQNGMGTMSREYRKTKELRPSIIIQTP